MKRETIQYINLLRIIATISVIFIHVGAMLVSSQGLKYGDNDYMEYIVISNFFTFAVPIFILISGALLLNPAKKISYDLVFKKYILRIIRALIIFGFPMCLIEAYMSGETGDSFLEIVITSLCNLACGKCWSHMWYLYMLIGLYLLTPLYKGFISNSNKKEIDVFVGIMFVLCILFPYINHIKPLLFENYIFLPAALFLYPCGYYIANNVKQNSITNSIACILLLFHLFITLNNASSGRGINKVYDPFTVCSAISIFHLCKSIKLEKYANILDRISSKCFGIYIVHAIFLNIVFKFIHIEKYVMLSPLVNSLIIVILVFWVSYLSVCVLRKIPYLKEKML